MKYLLIGYCGFAAILVGALQSCAVAGQQSEQAADVPKILFLTYSIEKDSTGTVQVALISQKLVEGSFKPMKHDAAFKPGDLKCVALDEKKQPLNSTVIPDPLVRSVEYADEQGKLARKEVQLDQTEFPVRMQMPAKARFIAIERMNASGSTTLLISEINRP